LTLPKLSSFKKTGSEKLSKDKNIHNRIYFGANFSLKKSIIIPSRILVPYRNSVKLVCHGRNPARHGVEPHQMASAGSGMEPN